ncbi:MAG: hypothetical protein JWP12_1226 [Bacteroidetes bacterium]|nr:hypothetical protein [Bacteroidota bacterium]
MNHLTSSKIRHFLDAFTGKHNETINSGQTVKNTAAPQMGSSTNFWGHGFEADGLSWDEYGNPYVINDTVH